MHKPLNQEFIHLTLLVRSVRCSLYGTTLYCIHTALDATKSIILHTFGQEKKLNKNFIKHSKTFSIIVIDVKKILKLSV